MSIQSSGGAMRTATVIIAATTAFAPLMLATSAPAFPGHGSCAEEAQLTIVALAQQRLGGELAPPLAQSQQLVGVIEANQAELCEPRP